MFIRDRMRSTLLPVGVLPGWIEQVIPVHGTGVDRDPAA
jgi:hypothetical protein